jgi:5-methylcytosine-specific restriction endonuclease McrA
MNSTEYENYLQSDKWKELARKRLEYDGYTCQMCGSRGTVANPLEVHHLSYKNIGEEQDRVWQDLVTLCHCCHKGTHAMMCRKTAPNRYGWKDAYNVPAISVYTLTGKTLEHKEVGALHEQSK